jgi:hypothetical protein
MTEDVRSVLIIDLNGAFLGSHQPSPLALGRGDAFLAPTLHQGPPGNNSCPIRRSQEGHGDLQFSRLQCQESYSWHLMIIINLKKINSCRRFTLKFNRSGTMDIYMLIPNQIWGTSYSGDMEEHLENFNQRFQFGSDLTRQICLKPSVSRETGGGSPLWHALFLWVIEDGDLKK